MNNKKTWLRASLQATMGDNSYIILTYQKEIKMCLKISVD